MLYKKEIFCYNNVGKRCIIKTKSQEVFKKYTGIFAISIDGIIGWKLYEKGGIDSLKLINFLEKYITNKYKNKLIILDNASSHRNELVKEVINKNNYLLHTVVYQHFTNAIENYFSVLKSKLRKLEGLTYEDLKKNIKTAIKLIPIEYYSRILKGSYIREKEYYKKASRKHNYKNYKD